MVKVTGVALHFSTAFIRVDHSSDKGARPILSLLTIENERNHRNYRRAADRARFRGFLESYMRVPVLCLLGCLVFPFVTHAQQVPVFEVSKADSVIKFSVSASVKIEGNFDKWDASMTFTSPELSTAVLTSRFRQTV